MLTTSDDDLLSTLARTTTSSVIRDLLILTERPGMLSLAGGLPAPELLPVAEVGAAVQRVLDSSGARALQYSPTEGTDVLRGVVAARLGVDESNVLVTTGSQQALDLLARSLVDRGDVVVVEAPSYVGALQAWRAAGADIVAVPADRDGLRTDLLAERLEGGLRPKVVYVVTDFQNPAGTTLAPPRRVHLAALADRYGFVLVDDNPYGELRFRGTAGPALRTLTDRAVSLGTASKILAPGLRIAWCIPPAWLYQPLVRTKQTADLHTSTINQLVVADLLSDAAFMSTHLTRLRAVYRERADALVCELAARLGGLIEVDPVDGGLFAWGRLTDGRRADELLRVAVEHLVAFVPGDAFYTGGGGADRLRLCFSTLTPQELAEAVDRLGSAAGVR